MVKKTTVLETLPEVIFEMQELIAQMANEFEKVIFERKGYKMADKALRAAILKFKKLGLVYRRDSIIKNNLIKARQVNEGSFKKGMKNGMHRRKNDRRQN